MQVKDPKDGTSRLAAAIAAVEGQLLEMKEDLEELHHQVRMGKLGRLKDAQKTTAEIRQWLKIALETEVRLEQRRAKENARSVRDNGSVGDIDLDAARTSIGCRLDRLRRTRCPGCIPE
ncbi:MAG: hypothetical protein CSA70_01290 [Rhodobacterales bacterium]|nr:MAG: hypothetical protein CSA70_01290 [Rhodobacterales bacterium]